MNLKQLLHSIREANLATKGPRGNRPSVEHAFAKVKKAAGAYLADPKSGKDQSPSEKKQSKKDAEEQLKHNAPARTA
jgi:hypothetical protein|tara:strand:- start:9845 stop:10075 length:231 start_codon:yes stop_codon:yes gene_type:complete